MSYLKFNQTNNAKSLLKTAISSWAWTILLTDWEGALFPATNFKVVIEKFNTSWQVTKREVVDITSRTTDTLTVWTRASEECVQDDTASPKTQAQDALSFDAWDQISIYFTAEAFTDVQDEATRLETDKVDLSVYNQEKNVFEASTQWDDDYQITDATITAYQEGQPIRFKCDVPNTWPATLEINALWAKSLEKNQWTEALITWDILANWIVTAIYNASLDLFQFVWEVATVVIPKSEVESASLDYVLWEDATVWKAMSLNNADWKIYLWWNNFVWILQVSWLSWETWKVNTWYDKNQSWLIEWDYYWFNLVSWVIESWNIFKALSESELSFLNGKLPVSWKIWDNITAASNLWKSVTYWNWLFVAVSYTWTLNRVMTSPDWINWTIRTTPVDNSWWWVTYWNWLFVAVSYDWTLNRIMTSPDWINWTIRTTPVDNNWWWVTYWNWLFVAVAGSWTWNRVMTSPDWINWTIRTSAADNNWNAVTYWNWLFVAVSNDWTWNRVMTSPDWITWTTRTSASNNGWFWVTYWNWLFVAVANDWTLVRVMTSPDWITWTTRTNSVDNGWKSITYWNWLFVAVSNDWTWNRVMTSPDWITWTTRTSAADNSWNAVTYWKWLFVSVASNSVMASVI